MFREEKAKNCVERKELLGTGSFGSVYRGDLLQAIDGKRKEVAVKIVPYSGNDIDQLGRELYFLKRFNSPFTVGYFDSFVSHSELWILMEICDSGSLLDIYRSSEKSLTEAELRAVIACSALGLLHVHEQQAIHRDIKAGNILLCSSGKVMLSDFGVSTKLTDTLQRRNTVIGTPYWMAPEILLESSYRENVDVWSLGVTVLEMAEKKPPHNGVKPISAMFLITYKPAPILAEPNKWSTEMQHFLSRCLIKDPNLRASSKEIAEHAWIKKEVAILRQCQVNNQNCSLPVLIELAKRNVETIRQNRLKIIEACKDDDSYGDSVEMVMDEDMCTETWDDKRNPRPRGGSVERNDFIKRAWQTKHFDVSHAKGSPLEESMRLKTEGVDYNNNGMSKVTEIVKELNSPRAVYTAAAANDNMKTAGTNDTFVYKRPVVGGSNSDKTPVKKNSIILLNNSDHNKNNNNSNNNPPSSRSPITKQQYQAQQMKGRGGISNSNHNKTNGDDDDDTVELNNAQTQALRTAITQVNNDSDKSGNDGTLRMGQFDVAVATALAASNNHIPIKNTVNNNKSSNKTATAATIKQLQPDSDTVFLLRQLDKLSAYDSARTNTSDKDDNNNNNNDDSASGRRSSTSSNGDSNNRPLNRIGRSSTVSSCSSNHNTLKPSNGYGGNNYSGVGNNHTHTTSPAKPRRKSFVIEIPDKFTGVVERLTHILDHMDDFTGMNSPRYNMNNNNANNSNGTAATAAAVPRREFKEVSLPISQQSQSKNEYKASAKTTTSSSISSPSTNNSRISSGSKGTAATTTTAAAKTASPTNNSTTAAAAKTTTNASVTAAAAAAAKTTAAIATNSAKTVAAGASTATTTTSTSALSSSAEAKTATTKSPTTATTSKSVAPAPVLKTTATTTTNANNNNNTATTAISVSPLRSAANSVSAAAATFLKSTTATAGTVTTERPKTTASTSSSSSTSSSTGMGTMTFSSFLDGRRRTSSAALPVQHSSSSTSSSSRTGAAAAASERVRAMSTATAPVSLTERRYSTTAVAGTTTTTGFTAAVPLTSTSNKSTAAIPPSTTTTSNNITKPSQVSLRTTPKPPSY